MTCWAAAVRPHPENCRRHVKTLVLLCFNEPSSVAEGFVMSALVHIMIHWLTALWPVTCVEVLHTCGTVCGGVGACIDDDWLTSVRLGWLLFSQRGWWSDVQQFLCYRSLCVFSPTADKVHLNTFSCLSLMQDPPLCPAHSSTVWSITHHSDQQWRRLSNKCRGEEVEQEILECRTWTLYSYTEPPNISYLIFGSSVSLIIYNQYQLKKRDWLHCCHDILTSIQYHEKYQFLILNEE